MDQNFWMNPRRPMGAQWQGGAGLLGERVPTRETLPATPPGTTDEFIDGRWVPRDGMVPPPLRNRFSGQIDPATGGGQLQQYLGYEEEIPQTQRPARQTNKWPASGTSIADSFMHGWRRFMNQVIPPAY
jgi:hypothetical protein